MTLQSVGEETDAELLAACRQGDADAWASLIKRYEPLVFSVPLHYGLSRVEAEDVVQTTFIILLEGLATLRSDSNLSAWLCTVARRHTWRFLRREAREVQPEPADDLDWTQLAEALGAKDKEAFEHWEVAEWLNQGMQQLNERCRELLTALYFEPSKKSYGDIVREWGMPLGSIGPTRTRCLERLRQILLKP